MTSTETQLESAQRMYDARAPKYEDSWHPAYTARFVKLLGIRPGQRILDVCCGTGLEAFMAAELVGDEGQIIGVDISRGMLAQALERQEREPELGKRIKFIRHDVTNLASLPEMTEEGFDFIICLSAFVLLQRPAEVIAGWRRYLKPDGILAIDIPHEYNMRSGITMSRVAHRLGVQIPYDRTWATSKDSFRNMLEEQGFKLVKFEELTNATGFDRQYQTVDEADELFDFAFKISLPQRLDDAAFVESARRIFKEEFAKDAVDGKVKVVDSLYAYLAKTA